MKFEFQAALKAVAGFALLLAAVCVAVFAFAAYIYAFAAAGNWLTTHYPNHIVLVFVTMIAVFAGTPVFVLGGFGFFKDRYNDN